MGELIAPETRRRLALSLVGSVLISLLDMLGVLAMLPMMQLIAGAPVDAGALGQVGDLLGGDPTERTLVIALACFIVGAFIVKDVVSIFFRIWQLRFMADQEVATSTRILRGYLVGPYAWHLARNTGDKLWTVDGAVAMGFATGIGSALALATEVFTIVLIFVGLLIATPFAAMVALVYFGISGLVLQRMIRQRVRSAAERNQAASRVTSTASLQALGRVQGDQAAAGRGPVRGALPAGPPRGGARPGVRDPAERAAEVPPRDRLRLRDRAAGVRGDDRRGPPAGRRHPRPVRGGREPDPAQHGPPHRRARRGALQPPAARAPDPREPHAGGGRARTARPSAHHRGTARRHRGRPRHVRVRRPAGRAGAQGGRRTDPRRPLGRRRRARAGPARPPSSTWSSVCTSPARGRSPRGASRSSTTCRRGRRGWPWCPRTSTSSTPPCGSTSSSTSSRTTPGWPTP